MIFEIRKGAPWFWMAIHFWSLLSQFWSVGAHLRICGMFLVSRQVFFILFSSPRSQERHPRFLGGHRGDGLLPSQLRGWNSASRSILTSLTDYWRRIKHNIPLRNQERRLSFLGGHGGDGPLPSQLGGWNSTYRLVLTSLIDPGRRKNMMFL